jgi:hypothetical protein
MPQNGKHMNKKTEGLMILTCLISLAVTIGCSGPLRCVAYTPTVVPTLPPRTSAAAISEDSKPASIVDFETIGVRYAYPTGKSIQRMGFCIIGLISGRVDQAAPGSWDANYNELLAEVLRKSGEKGGDLDVLVLSDRFFLPKTRGAEHFGFQYIGAVVMRRTDGPTCPPPITKEIQPPFCKTEGVLYLERLEERFFGYNRGPSGQAQSSNPYAAQQAARQKDWSDYINRSIQNTDYRLRYGH